LQNRLIQTSQTGGQWYSVTSLFSIPWYNDHVTRITEAKGRAQQAFGDIEYRQR
jgi:hypothetical protein